MTSSSSSADTRRKRRGIKKETGTAGVKRSVFVKSGNAPPARKKRIKTKKGSVKGNLMERKETLRLASYLIF